MRKEVIILTKSDKFFRYCVAGIESRNGRWIRLTLNEENDAIPAEVMVCDNGREADILDVIEIDCLEQDATERYPHQPENVFVDTEQQFRYIRTSTWQEVLELHPAETARTVLNNTARFQSDRLRQEFVQGLNNKKSLQLIKVQNLVIHRNAGAEDEGNRIAHPKANYTYINSEGEALSYCQTVTDPDYLGPYTQDREIGEAYLIVSLAGEAYSGSEGERHPAHYLLIAKIVEMTDTYPYREELGIVNCVKYLMELGGIEQRYFTRLKRYMQELMEECGFTQRINNRTQPTECGMSHGIVVREGVNSAGETYEGVFYGRECQEIMYSRLPEIMERLVAEENAEN